jgi:hypothetical protein
MIHQPYHTSLPIRKQSNVDCVDPLVIGINGSMVIATIRSWRHYHETAARCCTSLAQPLMCLAMWIPMLLPSHLLVLKKYVPL